MPKTLVDLFCGAGGFSRGFSQAGLEASIAIDKDYNALQAYQSNFPGIKHLKRDIRNLHSLEILKEIGTEPDVVLASPSCEPFTGANAKRRKSPYDRLYSDPEGRLMLDAIRIIGDLKPRVYVIENVVPVMEGELKECLKEELAQVGFPNCIFNIIYAENHNIPSERKRLFISNVDINPLRNKYVTVEEAFKGIPPPGAPHDFKNHFEVPLSPKYRRKVSRLPWGRSLVFFRSSRDQTLTNYIRLHPKRVSKTVMGNSRFIHPFEDRLCTPREHARLMSFPDEHIFSGSIEDQYNQSGEAVPPRLAFMIGQEVRKVLAG